MQNGWARTSHTRAAKGEKLNPTDSILALLFVSDEPVSAERLALALGLTQGQVDQAIEILQKRLEKAGPLSVIEIAGGFQLATKREYADLVSQYLRPQRSKLSKSLMEVLAIVAYRQPVTTAEIELVRGVQSDYSIRGLLERHLIREVGRRPTPGRPVLYGTTQQFLHQFNLKTTKDLPEMPEALDVPISAYAPSQGELAIPE